MKNKTTIKNLKLLCSNCCLAALLLNTNFAYAEQQTENKPKIETIEVNNKKKDPLETINRGIYKVNKTLDYMYIKPLAYVYKGITPAPVRGAVSNFFNNISEIPTILNEVLQGNPKHAIQDVFRFIANSTMGIFGLFDVASPMGMPRHDQDFGKTLAKWGYKSSSYLVLPILGPSTIRDGIGLAGNTFMTPSYYLEPKWRNRYMATYMVQKRTKLLDNEEIIDVASVDEYAFVRDAYLQHRDSEIIDTPEQQSNNVLLEGPPE